MLGSIAHKLCLAKSADSAPHASWCGAEPSLADTLDLGHSLLL